MTILFNFINFALFIAIIYGAIKLFKKFKTLFSNTKQMDKKLDTILNKLD